MRISNTIMMVMILAVSDAAFAKTQAALFNRCYMQLVGTDNASSDPLYASVVSGKMTAAAACAKILNAVVLDASTGTIKSASATNLSVLEVFHNLHASFFATRGFVHEINSLYGMLKTNVYSQTAPAEFFTHALFGEAANAESILSGNVNLRAIRDGGPSASPKAFPGQMNPQPNVLLDVDLTIFGSALPTAQAGTLLGIRPSGLMAAPWVFKATSGTVDFGEAYGGGLLGSPAYLGQNQDFFNKADGGIRMRRAWSRSVYKDLLCRDVPVVDPADVESTYFVNQASDIPFRTSSSCAVCHASLDRMAGVTRNLYQKTIGAGITNNKEAGTSIFQKEPVSLGAESGWPSVADTNFYKRPPNGRLFYRDYQGHLVDESFSRLEDLGDKIRSRPDFYICIAKRYYEYFSGLEVHAGYIGKQTLDAEGAAARAEVIKLGTELESTHDMKQLIANILNTLYN